MTNMICNECETVAHCLKNGCVPKTTKQTEAMKLALEALEFEAKAWEIPPTPTLKAINALGEALALVNEVDQEQPAQRQWVGLTDEERNHARHTVTYSQLAMTAGEWAEAVQIETEKRLKEKNT